MTSVGPAGAVFQESIVKHVRGGAAHFRRKNRKGVGFHQHPPVQVKVSGFASPAGASPTRRLDLNVASGTTRAPLANRRNHKGPFGETAGTTREPLVRGPSTRRRQDPADQTDHPLLIRAPGHFLRSAPHPVRLGASQLVLGNAAERLLGAVPSQQWQVPYCPGWRS